MNPDQPDKIIDEYQKGHLPFSDLYRDASEGEECPDELSAGIIARAANRQPSRAAGWRIHAPRGRIRIWIEAALLTAAAIALIVALNGPRKPTDLECPGVGARGTPGPERGADTPDSRPRPVP